MVPCILKTSVCVFRSFNMAAPGKERNFSGRGSPQNTLIIRHLPSSMNSMEKQDFLKYFGAEHAKVLSNYGRMVSLSL